MGEKELSDRKTWQDRSGIRGEVAEGKFEIVFLRAFSGSDYEIRSKPKELRKIYSENPPHGVIMDYAITNTKTNKTLYIEIKRQDGYVPGETEPNAGRGNAHERSCKFFTPGLLKIMRKFGKLSDDVLPFWVVYQGRIARDTKRINEITYWFGNHKAHFFLWKNQSNSKSLMDHFNNNLKHILD